MPVVAPRGTLDPAIRYVAQFQWDNSVRHETWIRVLLVEGLFDLEEAQSFLDQHFELRDQPNQNVSPASQFSGAVVATMLKFGPAPNAQIVHTIMHLSQTFSSHALTPLYHWAVIRHILTFQLRPVRTHLYVLYDPWWDSSGAHHSIHGAQATQQQAKPGIMCVTQV